MLLPTKFLPSYECLAPSPSLSSVYGYRITHSKEVQVILTEMKSAGHVIKLNTWFSDSIFIAILMTKTGMPGH
jgi:hypothetical protein